MSKFLGIFFGMLSAVAYGTNPLFGVRLIRAGFPVDSMMFWRFFGAAVLLAPVALFSERGGLRVPLRAVGWLALLGALFAFSAEALFWSFTKMSAGVASTLLFSYPIFTALIMSLFFGEKFGLAVFSSIFLAVAGVAAIALDGAELSVDFLGSVFVLLSALSYAFYMVIIKKASPLAGIGGLKLTLWVLGLASVFTFAKCAVAGGVAAPQTASEILDSCGLALIPTAVSTTAIAYSVKYAGPTVAAVLGAFEPLTAVSLSVVFLGESCTANLVAGIVLIVSAVVILTFSDCGKTPKPDFRG